MTPKKPRLARYIAFLRAINVGARTVKMDRLRELFTALRFANVETFIASGNVIFESAESADALESRIEAHLAQSLGFPVTTFLRTPEELAAVASGVPFPAGEREANSLYVGFLHAPPTAEAAARLARFQSEDDQLRVQGREVYWLSRIGMGRSPISGAQLEKALGMPATFRSITTVTKLAAKGPLAG